MSVQLKATFDGEQYLQDPQRKLVNTPEKFQTLVTWLTTRKEVVLDYETSGLAWYRHARACGLGLASWDDDGRLWAAYVPIRHTTTIPQLPEGQVIKGLGRILSDPDRTIIAHNIKFEDHFTRREGLQIIGPRYDTMIAARLYDDNSPLGLEKRAARDLGLGNGVNTGKRMVTAAVAHNAKRNKQPIRQYLYHKGYSEVPVPLMTYYGCGDVLYEAMLYKLYRKWGVDTHFERIWKTEMALTKVLCDMEEHGLPVDQPYLTDLKERVQRFKAEQERRIYAHLGREFNPGSDADVRALCLETLKLPLWKKTRGQKISVDEEALRDHADQHLVLQWLLDWRDADKIDTTYTSSIISKLDNEGIVHGDLKQVGTNTGRLSCAGPNYQNFPTDSNERALGMGGKSLKDGGYDPWSIRRAFSCRPGHVRLFADYSQIELRCIAYYSMDPEMLRVYAQGEDIHTRTAEEISKILGKECPRRIAKEINFGLSYCRTAKGIAMAEKILESDVEAFMRAFFQRYPGVIALRERLWKTARQQGCQFTNLFGRPRRLPNLNARDKWDRLRAERQAIGTLIQGTAAELTKESLVRLSEFIEQSGIDAKIVNTVHDEIQIDVPEGELHLLAPDVKELMEAYPEFTPVPITVDLEVSRTTWADKQKYHNE